MTEITTSETFISIKTFKKLLLVCLGLTFLIIAIYLFNFYHSTLKIDSDKWSSFGTVISGTVGTLLSFAGLLLIYLTFKEQKETIKNQNKEFELTKYDNYFNRQSNLTISLIDKLDRVIQDFTIMFEVNDEKGNKSVEKYSGFVAINFLRTILMLDGKSEDKSMNSYKEQIISEFNYNAIIYLLSSVNITYSSIDIEYYKLNKENYVSDINKILKELISKNINHSLTNLIQRLWIISTEEKNKYIPEWEKQKKANIVDHDNATLEDYIKNFHSMTSFFIKTAYPIGKYFEIFKLTDSIGSHDKQKYNIK